MSGNDEDQGLQPLAQAAEESTIEKEDAAEDLLEEREAAKQTAPAEDLLEEREVSREKKESAPAEDAEVEQEKQSLPAEANGSSRGNISVETRVEEAREEAEKDEEETAELAFEKKPLPQPEKIRLVEASLFQANKALAPAELAIVANCSVKKARELVLTLQKEYAERETAIQVEFLNDQVRLAVKPEFLPHVSKMSKEVEVSRKGMKILALIAKKGKMLQSELPRYFKGEIYDYVTDLKELGYITSEKAGRSRVLKPTKRFHEHFQTMPM